MSFVVMADRALSRNCPTLVRAKFPLRPIQQHDIVFDPNRQEALVGCPHMQTPQGLNQGADARGWTIIGRTLFGFAVIDFGFQTDDRSPDV
jgi:hypothetical protein